MRLYLEFPSICCASPKLPDHFNNLPFRNVNFSQINWVKDEFGLTRKLSKQARAQRQAFNAMRQNTGADHLRWLMNNMDAAVENDPQFSARDLILTVHDSLIYEVPDGLVDDFVAMARPAMETPTPWCDIAIKVGTEAGKQYGEMQKI